MKFHLHVIFKAFLVFIILSSSTPLTYAKGGSKPTGETNKGDKTAQVKSALAEAEQLKAAGKTKKAIVLLESIIPDAKACKNAILLESVYGKLAAYCEGISNKKVSEYSSLYMLMKTEREKKELEKINRNKEKLLSRVITEKNASEKETESVLKELESKSTELETKTSELLQTKDSLSILDLINREKESQISLLNKEKELQDLKVKEQALLLKEQEARQKLTIVIIGSLILGLITLSFLAFFIYKNFRQKKRYSEQIEDQLEVIRHQHENITNSINYAERIQKAMLPSEKSLHQLVPDSFILFKPKDIVSGDFYWFYSLMTDQSPMHTDQYGEPGIDSDQARSLGSAPSRFLVAAVDCTGHGVPGAFMSMIGYNLLNTIVMRNNHDPDLMLSELHRNIRFALQQYKTNNKDGMDMALCKVDKQQKIIEFAGAKNPVVVIKEGVLEFIKGDKHAVGGSEGDAKRTYTKHTIALDKPTTLYLFSDGFEDQFGGPDNRKFMIKNFRELLLKIHLEPFDKQREILQKTLSDWMGKNGKQIDDILVIGMKIMPD